MTLVGGDWQKRHCMVIAINGLEIHRDPKTVIISDIDCIIHKCKVSPYDGFGLQVQLGSVEQSTESAGQQRLLDLS